MRKQVLAALGVVVISGVALAMPERGRGPEPGPGRIERLSQELGLTDEQLQQLRKLGVEHARQNIQRRAEIEIARLDLRELVEAATLDEKAVAAKVKELSDLHAGALKARVQQALDFRKALTPEQQEKWRSLRLREPRGPRPARGAGFERRPLAESEGEGEVPMDEEENEAALTRF